MNRRDFLKYLLATPIATQLDVEKLLWIPEKTIFLLPVRQLTTGEIIAIELERVLPKIKTLFEYDGLFYQHIISKEMKGYTSR